MIQGSGPDSYIKNMNFFSFLNKATELRKKIFCQLTSLISFFFELKKKVF